VSLLVPKLSFPGINTLPTIPSPEVAEIIRKPITVSLDSCLWKILLSMAFERLSGHCRSQLYLQNNYTLTSTLQTTCRNQGHDGDWCALE
jgi:hypothetical protein